MRSVIKMRNVKNIAVTLLMQYQANTVLTLDINYKTNIGPGFEELIDIESRILPTDPNDVTDCYVYELDGVPGYYDNTKCLIPKKGRTPEIQLECGAYYNNFVQPKKLVSTCVDPTFCRKVVMYFGE